ncbi:hypothetical protein POVWA1_050470 [Plasmodium ovale wallikeri]|uniref:Uncharacterized protein n=1 Tax=Plasmodium ovale wallikeri TaxID=864142 RepID=A0A1A8ZLM9_PLAOA|nr:hypothetical protein POVWA1_050470 [Plasmodium ovale wallikeri]
MCSDPLGLHTASGNRQPMNLNSDTLVGMKHPGSGKCKVEDDLAKDFRSFRQKWGSTHCMTREIGGCYLIGGGYNLIDNG